MPAVDRRSRVPAVSLSDWVLRLSPDRARDLGVVNIASAAPQALGPLLAAPIVTHLGGYPALFILTGVVTLLGAVAVVKIRSVR